MYSRKEKEGLATSIKWNGRFKSSSWWVPGGPGGGTSAEPKKKEGLAFKTIFLSPAGLS